ncbi:hypothetical protein H7F15_06345 [Pontibacter sp. Tf4]|uniref:hypothetical protein n=1 Tax=Pontibacter sp. Tf4 TaxID=2761620 RepID=UPI00162ADDEC|nr:hypothetical protein [Pontibacter sp. Tf4]MBB6610649.1 hypothetical protein [Pontibacter sp. Tf4]
MKNLFVLSLLAVMLLQTFSKVLVLVDYQANKEYIMEFLCINRDKPELKCEGKCQLTKRLKAQHDTDKQANERGQKQEAPVHLFCQSLFALKPFRPATIVTNHTGYTCSYSSVAYQSIFHPPQFIV